MARCSSRCSQLWRSGWDCCATRVVARHAPKLSRPVRLTNKVFAGIGSWRFHLTENGWRITRMARPGHRHLGEIPRQRGATLNLTASLNLDLPVRAGQGGLADLTGRKQPRVRGGSCPGLPSRHLDHAGTDRVASCASCRGAERPAVVSRRQTDCVRTSAVDRRRCAHRRGCRRQQSA